MREIKFKLWDSYINKMMGPYTLYELREAYEVTAHCFDHVMQYTGIKDKNERPIYEGDILGSDNFSLPVKFHKYQGRWFASSGGSYILWAHKFKQFEIIGNIYTDKELLG